MSMLSWLKTFSIFWTNSDFWIYMNLTEFLKFWFVKFKFFDGFQFGCGYRLPHLLLSVITCKKEGDAADDQDEGEGKKDNRRHHNNHVHWNKQDQIIYPHSVVLLPLLSFSFTQFSSKKEQQLGVQWILLFFLAPLPFLPASSTPASIFIYLLFFSKRK